MKNNLINIKTMLTQFWAQKKYCEFPETDLSKGAGTSDTMMLYQIYKQKKLNMFSFHRCRRPQDSIFNWKNRLFCHTQCQVITMFNNSKTSELLMFKESLKYIFDHLGLDFNQHTLTFWEDNWKQETINAIGTGWEVKLDGIEIAQITYFHKVLGKKLDLIPIEFAYGLERLCSILQDQENIMDINYFNKIKYCDLFYDFENQISQTIEKKEEIIQFLKSEIIIVQRSIEYKNLYQFIEHLIKCSHWLNLLSINKQISIQEYKIWLKKVIDISMLYHENLH